jgi:hypothetical protein
MISSFSVSLFGNVRGGLSGVVKKWFLVGFFLLALSSPLNAQLPPESVILSKVKISEKQKSDQLCPVHLVASDSGLPTFKYKGVSYRGHTPECQSEFEKEPEKYASDAKFKRWENNFVVAMSPVWCPVTDQVNPGGLSKWEKLGLKWESCCIFCNTSVFPDCFSVALDRLKARAKKSFDATDGNYVEGAPSPITDAIQIPE